MKRSVGFTLLETLLSLALLLLMLGLAYGGIQQFMRSRSYQDAATSVQAKLRRVMEVFTQDLRSSVFGAIIDEPYSSGEHAVSFALLGKRKADGEIESQPGYKVYAAAPSTWKHARFTTIVSPALPDLGRGDHVLLVNQEKKAVILKLTAPPVPSGMGRWTLMHADCTNTLNYSPNTLLFPVILYGIRYDADRKELLLNEDGNEAPLAFDIEDFKVEYLPDRASPERLRLTIAANQTIRNRTITRSYTGVVDLYNNATFDIEEVETCNP